MITLAEVVSEGLADHLGVKIVTDKGKWSKVYPTVGQMWRSRGHTHFVQRAPKPGDAYDAGRRYLPADTEVCIVRIADGPDV